MKLFKEGKVFDLETSQLVGMSTWFTHYDTKRYKYYQSSKGTFFSIEERAETFNNPHCWVINKDGTKSTLGSLQETLSDKVKIKEVVPLGVMEDKRLMNLYDMANDTNRVSMMGTDTKYSLTFFRDYEVLFELEEV